MLVKLNVIEHGFLSFKVSEPSLASRTIGKKVKLASRGEARGMSMTQVNIMKS